jgi:hypothetical protein
MWRRPAFGHASDSFGSISGQSAQSFLDTSEVPMAVHNGNKANGTPSRLRETSADQGRQPRRSSSMKHSADREVCPKCGRPNARLIGRSETFPVLYLRCDDCNHTSVAPA